MKSTKKLLLLLLILASSSTVAFADDPAAGCAIAGCGLVVYLLVLFAFLAGAIIIDVLIIKWIKKDATAKGMPNADSIKWLGLLNWLGAVIYVLMRPKPTNQP